MLSNLYYSMERGDCTSAGAGMDVYEIQMQFADPAMEHSPRGCYSGKYIAGGL